MARDITVTLEDGSKHVYKGAPDNITPEQVSQRAQTEFGVAVVHLDGGKPPGLVDKGVRLAKVVGSGFARGLAGLPSLLAGGSAADYNEKAFGPGSFVQPTEGQLDPQAPIKAVESFGPKPNTTGERYLTSAAEGVGGSLIGPGGLAKNAMIGLSAGLGAEAAGQATSQHPLARLLGGLAGGGVTAGYQALKPNAVNLTKTATKGVTDQDWLSAKAVEMALDDMGMPHLKSQLLGPNSSLNDVVRDASSNQRVRPSLLSALRDVTGKAGQAFEVWANRNLPVQADERRDFLSNLQRIAADKERQLKGDANAEYRKNLAPDVMTEVYPEDFMKNLRDELTALAKDPSQLKGSIAGQSVLQDLLPRLATKGNGMAKGELNNIIKDLNTITQKEGWSGLGGTRAAEILKNYTSNDFGAARNARAAHMKDNLEPMQTGLAGDIAHARGGPRNDRYTATEAIINNVFPTDKAQPIAIRKLAEDVGGEQVGLLLREHLTKNFERAAKGLGEGEMTPAKFVEAVVGTPAQRKNIEAALMESAASHGQNPLAVKAGFQKLLNAFATYQDLKVSPGVSPVNLGFEAGKSAVGAAIAPQSRIARYMWEKATAKTYQQIADMVASKDGLKQIEAIARSQDPAYAQAIIRGMLATEQPDQGNSPVLQPGNPRQ